MLTEVLDREAESVMVEVLDELAQVVEIERFVNEVLDGLTCAGMVVEVEKVILVDVVKLDELVCAVEVVVVKLPVAMGLLVPVELLDNSIDEPNCAKEEAEFDISV